MRPSTVLHADKPSWQMGLFHCSAALQLSLLLNVLLILSQVLSRGLDLKPLILTSAQDPTALILENAEETYQARFPSDLAGRKLPWPLHDACL